MTYGAHHGQTASALAWLVQNDVPSDAGDVGVVLTCRAALLNAAQRRLDQALLGSDAESIVPGFRGYRRDLRGLATASPLLLAEMLREVPRLEDHTAALSDALVVEASTQTVQVWLKVARQDRVRHRSLPGCVPLAGA
jgi:hypothetical protein